MADCIKVQHDIFRSFFSGTIVIPLSYAAALDYRAEPDSKIDYGTINYFLRFTFALLSKIGMVYAVEMATLLAIGHVLSREEKNTKSLGNFTVAVSDLQKNGLFHATPNKVHLHRHQEQAEVDVSSVNSSLW